jgi:hypothetical protein
MHIRLVRGLVYERRRGFHWMVSYWTNGDPESVLFSERAYSTHAEAQLAMLAELNRLLRP